MSWPKGAGATGVHWSTARRLGPHAKVSAVNCPISLGRLPLSELAFKSLRDEEAAQREELAQREVGELERSAVGG